MTGSADDRLEATGVSKHFAGVRAVDDVTLHVSRGEVLGLMGPNGSGKSTLVNVIAGATKPTGGTVTLGGRVLSGRPPAFVARQGVARTFQNVRLFRDLTVHDNVVSVMHGRLPRGQNVDRVASALLARLGVAHLAQQRAGDLPYGLQRRLEIARALAINPRYVLLDEPAAGLNDLESEELEHVIRGLASDTTLSCGVLIIDHDMRLMAALCDRMHVLYNGTTLATGTPEQVRADPAVIEAYLGRSASSTDPGAPSR